MSKHASVEIVDIPVSLLEISDANVRRTDVETGITELADSIKRDGLIHNLTVVKAGKKYEVVAGGRRLRALRHLIAEKALPKSFEVPCRLVTAEDAAAISLAENQLREPMHALDQVDAFKARIDAGDSTAETANRFGVTETFVKQRLKLAAVSPALLDEYRAGNMTLEQLQAFTVSDDHAAQEETWSELKDDDYNNSPDDIKYSLRSDGYLSVKSPMLKFVGLAAYEKAGGKVLHDLFSEDGEDNGQVTDVELLNRLAREKLDKRAAKLQKDEGLAFALVVPGPWGIYNGKVDGIELCKAQTVRNEPSAEIAKQIETMNARLIEVDKRIDEIDDMDDGSEHDDEYQRLEAERDDLHEKPDAIENALEVVHPDEAEHLGAVLSIDNTGKVQIHGSLIKAENRAKVAKTKPGVEQAQAGTEDGGSNEQDEAPKPALSEKLIARLTAHKTAIMRDSIMPHVSSGELALVTMVFHLLIEDLASDICAHAGPLTFTTRHAYPAQHASDLEDSHAWTRAEKCADEWLDPIRAMLAEVVAEDRKKALWQYLAPLSLSHLLKLLAVCVANRVDVTVASKHAEPHSAVIEPVFLTDEMIAKHYWQPTRANFLDHVSKPVIIATVTEACGAEAAAELAPMKRDAAAARAEQLLEGTGWLPAPLRVNQ